MKSNKFMNRIALLILFVFSFTYIISPAYAKMLPPATIDQNIVVSVYSTKKTGSFTAVEIGFTNTTSQYVAFSPTEIYLDDKNKYSVAPLPMHELATVGQKNSNFSVVPLTLGAILGISAIAVSGKSKDAATGLAIAALAMGGGFIISEVLENKAKNNQLITFENNSLRTVDKLPPGVTLGGFLYFPKVKSPDSLTIMYKTKGGNYEKKIIPLKKISSPRKAGKYHR